MKVDPFHQKIELTRRNLLALLAKLDGNPPDSACTISKSRWQIKAVEDDEHYSDRRPGRMHEATEAVVRAGRTVIPS